MFALLWKDLLLEFRTKERISSLFVLSFLIVLVFVFALSPEQIQGRAIVGYARVCRHAEFAARFPPRTRTWVFLGPLADPHRAGNAVLGKGAR